MEDIIIENNSDKNGNYYLDGGGLYLNYSVPETFENIKIYNNHASNNGGGIFLHNSTIEHAIGFEVYSNNSNQNGGGIYSINSNLNIEGAFITYINENETFSNHRYIYCHLSLQTSVALVQPKYLLELFPLFRFSLFCPYYFFSS